MRHRRQKHNAMENAKKHRTLEGLVVSDKMQKTVVVAVSETRMNPKYLKQYNVTRRLKAHDEARAYHTGDRVVIEETRPLSRDKRWKVVKKAV
ncbi:MAG: 30S ribosomal protein S17 [Candidatus Harrisonbacteria bacterium]|nr:30S ribosomal protein S17 [Candidatus Harrisonbacteria bacterium]